MKQLALKDLQSGIKVRSTVNPYEEPILYKTVKDEHGRERVKTTFKPNAIYEDGVFKQSLPVNRIKKGGVGHKESTIMDQVSYILTHPRSPQTNPSLLIELKK